MSARHGSKKLEAAFAEHPKKPKRTNEEELQEHVANPDDAKTVIRALANKAMHLNISMPDYMHTLPWVQEKLDHASKIIGEVHDHLRYGDHTPMETPNTVPGYPAGPMTGPNL